MKVAKYTEKGNSQLGKRSISAKLFIACTFSNYLVRGTGLLTTFCRLGIVALMIFQIITAVVTNWTILWLSSNNSISSIFFSQVVLTPFVGITDDLRNQIALQ